MILKKKNDFESAFDYLRLSDDIVAIIDRRKNEKLSIFPGHVGLVLMKLQTVYYLFHVRPADMRRRRRYNVYVRIHTDTLVDRYKTGGHDVVACSEIIFVFYVRDDRPPSSSVGR